MVTRTIPVGRLKVLLNRLATCRATVAFLALAVPSLGSAQGVKGRVVDAATNTALRGALVTVLAPTGSALVTVLTSPEGEFRFAAIHQASFRIRVQMIGHKTWTSRDLRLTPSDTMDLNVRLDLLPIALPEIRAESRNLCARFASLPPVTAALWSDIETTLAAERLSHEGGALRFRLETFERDVAVDSMVVLRDRRQRTSSQDPEGFRSAPIRELADSGFFAATTTGDYLYGPTSAVLLDPWFVQTHCLSVAPPRDDGSFGVKFAPNAERHQPEIRGTLWLKADTRELRQVEFEYSSLPARIPAGSRGTAYFERLPDGSVMLREWLIRSPIIELGEIIALGERRPVERAVAYRESGGEVLSAQARSQVLYRARRATVAGTVFDSVNHLPLGNANVVVVGSGFSASSDSAGHYRLIELPPGTYRISFEHERLAAFGYRPEPVRITVDRGDSIRVDLAIPSRAKLLVSPEEVARLDTLAAVGRHLGLNMGFKTPMPEERQRASFDRSKPATVIGRVISHEDGLPLSGASIRLEPVGFEPPGPPATARTDGDGQFELPAVFAGEYLVVAEAAGYDTATENRVTVEQGLEYQWVIRLRRAVR